MRHDKVAKKFPKYVIPIFSCTLAHDSANHEKKMIGKKQIEIKLDGVRVLTIIRKNKVDTKRITAPIKLMEPIFHKNNTKIHISQMDTNEWIKSISSKQHIE